MTQTITLDLPDALYQSIHKVAAATQRPLDEVVRESLTLTLPPLDDVSADEAERLASLSTMGDAELWGVASQMMPEDEQAQVQRLLDDQSAGVIDEEGRDKLQKLINKSEKLVVEKAHAWLLLARRGYRVPVQKN